MMRIKLLLLCLLTSSTLLSQKTSHLKGDVTISLEDKTIDAEYTLSNLPLYSKTLSFRLNEYIKVKSIYLDGNRIASSKVPQNCNDCLTYKILVGCEVEITPDSELKIVTEGKFRQFDSQRDAKRYRGQLVFTDGILRAGNGNKWYPEIVNPTGNGNTEYMDPFNYSYSITANCDSCSSIYIGKGKPQPSGSIFENKEVTGDLVLIAGDLDFEEGDYANYINVPREKIADLESRFKKKHDFLKNITLATPKDKVLYAQLSSPVYGNEKTYHTIINTSENIDLKKIDENFDESDAFYFLSSTFKPDNKLDRMMMQSLAKYLKLRYLKKYNPSQYSNLNSYVKKSDVLNNRSQKTELQALLITPEQFLDLESSLGEVAMNTFIKDLFTNLKVGKRSLQAFTDSVNKLEIKTEYVMNLEKNLLNQYELRNATIENKEVITGF